MRSKVHTLFGNFTERPQGKYLKPAAVGEDRAIPVHKLVKPAHIADQRVTGAQMEVIGVGKLHAAVDLFQLHGGDPAFDRGAGAYVHKYRRFNVAVHGVKHPAAGAPVLVF